MYHNDTNDMTFVQCCSATSKTPVTYFANHVVYLIFLHTQLSVSKDFSLSLDVPPYLIRGEEIVLEVNLINHLEHEIEVQSPEWKAHTLFKLR